MKRPLLLVDVDGVISLFGFDPAQPPAGKFQIVDGIAYFLSAEAAEHLLALSEIFEPAWCTGWEEKANEYLPHALGLSGPWVSPTASNAPISQYPRLSKDALSYVPEKIEGGQLVATGSRVYLSS